jgi:hypothetical protein
MNERSRLERVEARSSQPCLHRRRRTRPTAVELRSVSSFVRSATVHEAEKATDGGTRFFKGQGQVAAVVKVDL